jgi:hypothetical protein
MYVYTYFSVLMRLTNIHSSVPYGRLARWTTSLTVWYDGKPEHRRSLALRFRYYLPCRNSATWVLRVTLFIPVFTTLHNSILSCSITFFVSLCPYFLFLLNRSVFLFSHSSLLIICLISEFIVFVFAPFASFFSLSDFVVLTPLAFSIFCFFITIILLIHYFSLPYSPSFQPS